MFKRVSTATWIALFFFASVVSVSSAEGEADAPSSGSGSVLDRALDAVIGGKPILDARLRYENAKIDTFQTSNSATGRVRIGYQTGSFYGLMGLAEFEATGSPSEGSYFDGVEANDSNQTVVADPDNIEINRYWLSFGREEWLDSSVKVGRQRIKLDDDRWIGNVGWRQNEQTYDAVRAQSSFGVDALTAQYIYMWEVNRIFGDQGGPTTRDYGQDTHLVHLHFDAAKSFQVTAFAYLIDANDPFAPVSSNTYGFRATGAFDWTDSLSSTYIASYAYQMDAADNPTHYDANYAYVEGGLALKKVGGLGVGFELLGSDDGDGAITTPFSTAHKFNGFADAFLNNGGPRGLRDFFVSVAPAIPIQGLKFKFIFHQFWDDAGGDDLGQEYDMVMSYPLHEHLTILYKFAYYDEGQTRSPESRVRNTIDLTLSF